MAPRPVRKRKTNAARARSRKSDWTVRWVKFVNDEDCIAKVKEVSDGYFIQDPLAIAYHNGIITLTPYGLMTENPDFHAAKEHVLLANGVNDSVHELYVHSVKLAVIARTAFEQLIKRSMEVITGGDFRVMAGPSDAELKDIDLEGMVRQVLGTPENFEKNGDGRSRDDVLDSLVELAERQGKGRKVES